MAALSEAGIQVMDWKEHARRSLWTSKLGGCVPHMLRLVPQRLDWPADKLGPGETFAHWVCEWCDGGVWTAALPAQKAGQWPGGLTEYVEELVSTWVLVSQGQRSALAWP